MNLTPITKLFSLKKRPKITMDAAFSPTFGYNIGKALKQAIEEYTITIDNIDYKPVPFPQNPTDFITQALQHETTAHPSQALHSAEDIIQLIQDENRIIPSDVLNNLHPTTIEEAIQLMQTHEALQGLVYLQNEHQLHSVITKQLYGNNYYAFRHCQILELVSDKKTAPYLLIFREVQPKEIEKQLDNAFSTITKTIPNNTYDKIIDPKTLQTLYFYYIYLHKHPTSMQGIADLETLEKFKENHLKEVLLFYWNSEIENTTSDKAIDITKQYLIECQSPFFLENDKQTKAEIIEYLQYIQQKFQQKIDAIEIPLEQNESTAKERLEWLKRKAGKRLEPLVKFGEITPKQYEQILQYTEYLFKHREIPKIEKRMSPMSMRNQELIYTYSLIYKDTHKGDKEMRKLVTIFLHTIFEQIHSKFDLSEDSYTKSTIYRKFTEKPEGYLKD